MRLLETVAVFLVTALAGLLMGIPFIAAAGRRRRWRAPAPLDSPAAARALAGPPAFEPLIMEPFGLMWPSEVDRPSTGVAELPWPSETWEDDGFGARAATDLQKMIAASAVADARAGKSLRVGAGTVHHAEDAREVPQPPPNIEAQFFGDAIEEPPPARPKRRATKKQKAPTPAVSYAAGVPDPSEIQEMVRRLGLAGAVEEIRVRTGWDFKQAAQHLATVLRDQR